MAQVTGLPLGSQLGLFPTGHTAAHQVDTAQLTTAPLHYTPPKEDMDPDYVLPDAAWDEGYQMGRGGKSPDLCRFVAGSVQREAWMMGHEAAQRANAAGIQPLQEGAPA